MFVLADGDGSCLVAESAGNTQSLSLSVPVSSEQTDVLCRFAIVANTALFALHISALVDLFVALNR